MALHAKRMLTGLASVAVMSFALAGLAACGSSSSSSSDSSSSDGVVEISYIHRLPDKEGMTTVNELVEQWNKDHPNIHVTATRFNGAASDLLKKLETDVDAGNAPDLAQIGYAELPEAYTKGILADVTDAASQYKSDFAEGAYNQMMINNQVYGLPQDTGPLVYYYNATEFDKLGLKVPTSTDDLISEAKTAASQGKYIMAYEADEAGNMFSGLAGASGEWYKVDGDAWVVNTDTDGSKAVADVFQQLLDNKAATTNARWDPSFDASLQNGELIGTVGAAWEAPLLMDSIGDSQSGQWRVAQIGDWFGNGSKTGPDGGSGVAALKGCEHPKEAMEFLDWFNTQIDGLTSQGLIVAATTGTATTPESWSKFYGGQDVMQEMATANDNMSEFAYIPGFSSVATAMKETAAKAADGSKKVSDVFTTAQTTSIDTLKDYGLSVKE